MLPKLLKEELDRQHLSLRSAARQIGIAHTTLARIIDGEQFSHESLEKLAAWLRVPPGTLLNSSVGSTNHLASSIAAALAQEPELAQVFGEAMNRVASGGMNLQQVRELAAFVMFRLQYDNKERPPTNVRDIETNRAGEAVRGK